MTDAEVCRGGKLVSPSRKRAAVERLQAEFEISERRACQLSDQQRLEAKARDDEEALVRRMRATAVRFLADCVAKARRQAPRGCRDCGAAKH